MSLLVRSLAAGSVSAKRVSDFDILFDNSPRFRHQTSHYAYAGIQDGGLPPLARVSAALLLATTALAGLSIQSVYREAQVRKRLIEDMHRSIADVIARLDAAMIEEERAATAELQSVPPRSARLLGKMREMEQFRPWLAPLVLLPTAIDADASPSDSGTERFHDMLAQAERAEYQDQSPARATRLYSSAASMISAGLQRAKALNGQARTELKAGDPLRAAATYKKLIDGAETLHPEEARIALIAWEQLAASHARRGDRVATGDASIGLYEFLLTHRFIIDEDTYSFYKSKVDEQLTHAAPDRLEPLRRREQQLDAAAPLLAAALSGNNKSDRVMRLPKSAHVWTLANVTTLLEHSLGDPGPWSDVRTAIVEDGAAPEAGRLRCRSPASPSGALLRLLRPDP